MKCVKTNHTMFLFTYMLYLLAFIDYIFKDNPNKEDIYKLTYL